jgi:hypothetical protein
MAAKLIDLRNIVYVDTRADIPADPPGILTMYFIGDESKVALVSKNVSKIFGNGSLVAEDATRKFEFHLEADGGMLILTNKSNGNIMSVAVNSLGDEEGAEDFVELYAKDSEENGTRLYVTPESAYLRKGAPDAPEYEIATLNDIPTGS